MVLADDREVISARLLLLLYDIITGAWCRVLRRSRSMSLSNAHGGRCLLPVQSRVDEDVDQKKGSSARRGYCKQLTDVRIVLLEYQGGFLGNAWVDPQ
jgi:hypothetical protein